MCCFIRNFSFAVKMRKWYSSAVVSVWPSIFSYSTRPIFGWKLLDNAAQWWLCVRDSLLHSNYINIYCTCKVWEMLSINEVSGGNPFVSRWIHRSPAKNWQYSTQIWLKKTGRFRKKPPKPQFNVPAITHWPNLVRTSRNMCTPNLMLAKFNDDKSFFWPRFDH